MRLGEEEVRGARDQGRLEGGGHFGPVSGGCLGLLPAGHAADRGGARGVLLVANVLMGLARCVGVLGSVTAGWLADPARGGSPAGALTWLALALPMALVASLGVRPRQV